MILLLMHIAFLTAHARQSRMDSLLALLKIAKDDTNKILVLQELSMECNEEDIETYAGLALTLSYKLNNNKGIAEAQSNLGYAFSAKGDFPRALRSYQESLTYFEKIDDKNGAGSVLNAIAELYKNRFMFPKALEYYQKSLTLKEKTGDKKQTLIVIRNIGQLLGMMGDYDEELKYQNKSLGIAREIRSREDEATALNNIGAVYNALGDHERAIDYHKKCINIEQEIKNAVGVSHSLSEIGLIFLYQNEFDSALLYFNSALKGYRLIANKTGLAETLNNIGGVYDRSGAYDEAINYFLQSQTVYHELGRIQDESLLFINIGVVYDKQKNYKAAEKFALLGLDLAKKSEYRTQMSMGGKLLSRIYAAQGKYKQAYEMHVFYKQWADSIRNAAIKDATIKNQVQFEFARKENELIAEQEKKDALAKAQLDEQSYSRRIWATGGVSFAVFSVLGFFLYRSDRKKKENQLSLELSQIKSELADVNMKAHEQMNEHFIFNAMQSIQHFINKNDKAGAEKYLIKFSNLTRRILENSRKQEITVQEEVDTLKLYMDLEALRLNLGFDYEIIIDTNIDPENTLIPPLILQPFVENSIKHGLSPLESKGRIMITIRRIGNELECIVEDNGVGRISKKRVSDSSVTDKQESLGMKITGERIKLYNRMKSANAFFKIEDLFNAENKSTGMRVLLHFPLSEV